MLTTQALQFIFNVKNNMHPSPLICFLEHFKLLDLSYCSRELDLHRPPLWSIVKLTVSIFTHKST